MYIQNNSNKSKNKFENNITEKIIDSIIFSFKQSSDKTHNLDNDTIKEIVTNENKDNQEAGLSKFGERLLDS